MVDFQRTLSDSTSENDEDEDNIRSGITPPFRKVVRHHDELF